MAESNNFFANFEKSENCDPSGTLKKPEKRDMLP